MPTFVGALPDVEGVEVEVAWFVDAAPLVEVAADESGFAVDSRLELVADVDCSLEGESDDGAAVKEDVSMAVEDGRGALEKEASVDVGVEDEASALEDAGGTVLEVGDATADEEVSPESEPKSTSTPLREQVSPMIW